MTRLAGVVVALLLGVLPVHAANIVPPGWLEIDGSGSDTGISDGIYDIDTSPFSINRDVSVAELPDGRPLVAVRGILEVGPQIIVNVTSGVSWAPLGLTEVRFNGVPADFVLVSPFEISTSVPAGATTGFTTVRSVLDTAQSPAVFTVTAP